MSKIKNILFVHLVVILFYFQKIDANETKNINVTVFVHGTYWPHLKFFIPSIICAPNCLTKAKKLKSDNHYMKKIAQECDLADSQNFPIDHFYTYGWSGKLDNDERIKASEKLYYCLRNLIERYSKHNKIPKITLMGHSHGGNVCINIAKFNKDLQIDRVIMLASPIQVQNKDLANHECFNKIYNIYSDADLKQLLDVQKLHEVNKNNKDCPIFSQRRLDPHPKVKQTKITIDDSNVYHVTFVTPKFFKILPKLLKEMDSIDYKHEYAIRAFTDNSIPFDVEILPQYRLPSKL